MKEGKAVYLSSTPNVDAAGGLMCCFIVFCPDRQKKRAVDSAIHSKVSRIGSSDFSPEEYSIFGRHCENFADADRTLEELKAIDGVQNASMGIEKELIPVQDWLKYEIDRRISIQ